MNQCWFRHSARNLPVVDPVDRSIGNPTLHRRRGCHLSCRRLGLNGTDGADNLVGGAGNDTLDTGNGNDQLYGRQGNDLLDGGSGDDQLYGEEGDDTLLGGTGNDTYIYTSGLDTIRDTSGTDILRFGTGVALSGLMIKVSATNGDDANVYINGQLAVIIENMFASGGAVETFQFADGSTLATGTLLARVTGTNGNDTLVGADRSYFPTDVLDGGNGDDRLIGGAGDDYLFGGAGNDTYVVAQGTDVISDTGGTADRIEFDARYAMRDAVLTRDGANLLVSFNGTAAAAIVGQFDGAGTVERIVFQSGGSIDLTTYSFTTTGTEGRDTLRGVDTGAGGDRLFGLGGDDYLYGYGGDDVLDGGAGNDTLDGGLGNDRFVVSAGGDTIRDGGGVDTIDFGGIAASQVAYTRDGNDLLLTFGNAAIRIDNQFTVNGQIETLSFAGGVTVDLLARRYGTVGDSTSETIYGISAGGNPDEEFYGAGGNDTIYGYAGNDLLDGGDGDDRLYGGTGGDRYYVGGGDDLVSDAGAALDAPDTIYLPAGIALSATTIARTDGGSLVIRWAGGSVTIDRAYDPLYAIETLVANGVAYDLLALNPPTLGTSADDQLGGNTRDLGSHDDRLVGLAGNDTLYGYDGADTLDGGDGDDALYGGAGGDVYLPGAGANFISDAGASGDAADRIVLPAGVALASVAFTRLADGDLMLTWAGGSVRIDGALNATRTIETLQDASGATLSIPAQAFATVGSSADETLSGNREALGSRNDTIYGYGGDDTLYGYDGADALYGGAGDDRLYGADGADRYYIGEGNDFIGDYGVVGDGADQIFLAAGIRPADVSAVRTLDGSLLLRWTGGSVRIDDAFDQRNAVEELRFATGEVWQLTARSYETIGTNGSETIYGNTEALGSRNDVLRGLDGDDTLYGYDGNDTLDGGAGADTLYGGAGADTYVVGYGWDTVSDAGVSGDGADVVRIDRVGITAAGLSFGRYASGDIRISWNGGADGVMLLRGLTGNNAIEFVELADGSRLSLAAQTFQTLVVPQGVTRNGDSGPNTLVGGDGDDTLSGYAGDDILDGGAGNDLLYGGTGADTYRLGTGHAQIYDSGNAGEIDRIVLTVAVAQSALTYTRGYDGSLLVSWGSGDARIVSAFDARYAVERLMLTDGTAIDLTTVAFATVGTGGADTLRGNLEALGSHDDVIRGLDGDDTLYGEDGNDTLDGGLGADTLYGGAGNDTYIVSGDDVLNDSGGTDRLLLPTGVTAAGLVATRDGNGNGNLKIAWTGGSATIAAAFDTARAIETLAFADGSTLALASLRLETVGSGNAESLGGNRQALGSHDDVIRGLEGDDSLYGYDGADTLDGGADDDRLYGDVGGDRYIVAGNDYIYDSGTAADAPDTIVLPTGVVAADLSLVRYDGGDLLLSWTGGSVRIVDGLDARYAVERLEFGTGASLALTALPFVTVGTNGNDRLSGNLDAFGSHDDVIRGYDGDDTLYGNDGADTLDGGPGDDELYGGEGGDTYIVGSGANFVSDRGLASDAPDTIVLPDDVTPQQVTLVRLNDGDLRLSWAGGSVRIDNPFDATTTVEQVRFRDGTVWQLLAQPFVTLGSGENETLSGNTRALGSHDDVIRGLDGRDTLYGYDGNDLLDGGAGNDRLYGGAGSDVLDGASGADELYGEGGDDVYVVDDAGDLVFESAGGGFDRVDSSVSYTLGAGQEIERLVLTGSAATSATGNALANQLVGNGAANVLTGGLGRDVLTGGAGSDVFRDTAAGLNGDTITDFAAGDRITISDATLAGFGYALNGTTLSYTGGSLTLSSVPAGGSWRRRGCRAGWT